jgi:hypothetical protein
VTELTPSRHRCRMEQWPDLRYLDLCPVADGNLFSASAFSDYAVSRHRISGGPDGRSDGLEMDGAVGSQSNPNRERF